MQQLIHASTYLWNDHNSIARSQKKNEKCDFKRMKNVTLDAPPLSPFVTFAMPTSIVQCTAHRWNLPLFHPVDLQQRVIELVSKELNHLMAILHVYAGDLIFM